jgi:alpha-glucosidase
MLSLHRELIRLRRASPSLAVGSYRHIYTDEHVLVFAREVDGERHTVALNFSDAAQTLTSEPAGQIVLSTQLDRNEAVSAQLGLRPNEGVIIQG